MNGEDPKRYIPPEVVAALVRNARTRPDALSVIPGQGIGTQAGPETYLDPISVALANISGAASEGTMLAPDIGFENLPPEMMWYPRILGILAGVAGVLEPGPDLPIGPIGKKLRVGELGRRVKNWFGEKGGESLGKILKGGVERHLGSEATSISPAIRRPLPSKESAIGTKVEWSNDEWIYRGEIPHEGRPHFIKLEDPSTGKIHEISVDQMGSLDYMHIMDQISPPQGSQWNLFAIEALGRSPQELDQMLKRSSDDELLNLLYEKTYVSSESAFEDPRRIAQKLAGTEGVDTAQEVVSTRLMTELIRRSQADREVAERFAFVLGDNAWMQANLEYVQNQAMHLVEEGIPPEMAIVTARRFWRDKIMNNPPEGWYDKFLRFTSNPRELRAALDAMESDLATSSTILEVIDKMNR